MARKKYPINREFFPMNHLYPSVSPCAIATTNRIFRIPRFLFRDPGLKVEKHGIKSFDGNVIDIYTASPEGIEEPAPCLLFIHGGGFVFEGFYSHFRLFMTFAKQVPCKAVYVHYRLAPEYRFPTAHEDAYHALCWIYDHAGETGIDRNRIGLFGDSAGGTLAAVACMMALDRRKEIKPLFQMLVYPYLDYRHNSESNALYTDTPVWNSTLSMKVAPLVDTDPEDTAYNSYRSPAERSSMEGLPPAYIEVAQYDCLHDDGVLFSKLLDKAGIEARLYETTGTMHGYDSMPKAPTVRKLTAQRIEYMKEKFCKI